MTLILNAAPIQQYGIIVNDVPRNTHSKIQEVSETFSPFKDSQGNLQVSKTILDKVKEMRFPLEKIEVVWYIQKTQPPGAQNG